MKKIKFRLRLLGAIALCLAVGMCACPMTACRPDEDRSDKNSKEIVCTTYAAYDWTRSLLQLAGDTSTFRVSMLSKGADMHSYQPTVADIVKLREADLFIYVGGVSEAWVSSVLTSGGQASASNALGLISLPGMQLLHTAEDHQALHGGQEAYDEHVWLSLENASVCSRAIAEKLAQLAPEKAQDYQAAAEAYAARCNDLQAEFQAALTGAVTKKVVVADRFPFRYLTEPYGIEVTAAFAGCEADAEIGFHTLPTLIDAVKETGLRYIIVTETSDQTLAKAVAESSGISQIQILIMDSMQSPGRENRESYLSVMEKNLSVLLQALGCER